MPIVTLTSDIGQQDYVVGAIKGQLLQVNPAFNIVDISHQLLPYNLLQAAFTTKAVLAHFPPGTLHLVLVGLFEKPAEHLLLVEHNGQYIGCANNGIVNMILEDAPYKVVGLSLPQQNISTISCLATWANAFNQLNNGIAFSLLGNTDITVAITHPLRPSVKQDSVDAQILYIDNFENVILNITKKEFESQRQGRNFKIVVRRDEFIEKISENYADVPDGEKLAFFNAAGYLEIALKKGNVAGLMGFQMFLTPEGKANRNAQSKLHYSIIKIFFEDPL
jgi:S-adenosyl-L-methionine hydrolase (adenosine-forming)